MKTILDNFISWLHGEPTAKHKQDFTKFYEKISGKDMTKTELCTFMRTGTINVPINSREALAATLMFDSGMVKILPSRNNHITIKLNKSKSSDDFEQDSYTIFYDFCSMIGKLQAIRYIKNYVTDNDYTYSNIQSVASKHVNKAAVNITSLLTDPSASLDDIFDAIITFNHFLSSLYMLNGKVFFQPDDIPNELDRIFDKTTGIDVVTSTYYISPFLLRVANYVLIAPLDDNASQSSMRVKASAPLIILWLADRLGIKVTFEQQHPDEYNQTKDSLDKL